MSANNYDYVSVFGLRKHCRDHLTDWDKRFLDSLIGQKFPATDKQKALLSKMVSSYGLDERMNKGARKATTKPQAAGSAAPAGTSYIYKKAGTTKAHIWSGKNSPCRNWHGGKFDQDLDNFNVSASPDGREVCRVCVSKSKKTKAGNRRGKSKK